MSDLLAPSAWAYIDADREDYLLFLAQYGLTEHGVRAIVEDMSDHVDMPVWFAKAVVGDSMIQGVGMFAAADIEAGEVIAPVRIDSRRTIVGRRMNHSMRPNCTVVRASAGNLYLQASVPIHQGAELTIDYRQAASVNVESGLTAQVPHALAAVRADALVVVNPQTGETALHHDGAAPQVIRERIERLKDYLLTLPDRLDLHVEHEITDGMYLRKLFIPAGTLVVGKVHLKHCHNVVAAGDISVLTEAGVQRLRAGFTGMSKPGTQKLGFAHAHTIFINVFRTDKTDLADIEAEIACEASARDRLELI